jgi:outer membrane autotransporter protein
LRVVGTANIGGATVGLNLISQVRVALLPGHKLTLLSSSGLSGIPANQGLAGNLGVTRSWTAGLTWDAYDLYAEITSVEASPESKALSEGALAGLSLVNQGADLIAGKGMAEAAKASGQAGATGGYSLGTFGAVSGGFSRYNTGSHVDMSSLSLISGLSFGADLPPGRLTLGAFFEYGNGSYNTYNSFSNAADIHGKGNAYYLGGGVLGRMDFVETDPGNFYAEASFRAGSTHNSYSNGDLRDYHGRSAAYDYNAAYYGLHAGLGYVWNFTEKASLDLYGKYFWTRQQGKDVTLSTDERVTFKDADSSRLRLGGRLAYDANEQVSPYIGAAWEREFDGTMRASAYGHEFPSPSLRGDTGIGELGLIFKPSRNLPLSIDLGVQGYAGKREGVTGSLQIRYEF